MDDLARSVSLDTYGLGNDRYGGPDGTRAVTGVPHQTDHGMYTVDDLPADLLAGLAWTGEPGKPGTRRGRNVPGLLARWPHRGAA